MSINNGEYGQTIRANIGLDVSGGTAYTMILEPKIGDILTKTATLGTVNVVDEGKTLLANQYVEYVLASGDITTPGMWRKRGQATVSGKEVIGNFERFMVMD